MTIYKIFINGKPTKMTFLDIAEAFARVAVVKAGLPQCKVEMRKLERFAEVAQ